MAVDKQLLYIWLSLLAGPASPLPVLLMNCFGGDIIKLYEASDADYAKISVISTAIRKKLSNKSLQKAEAVQSECRRMGIGLLTYESPLYPDRLRRISNPPILLYYRGILHDLEEDVCIGVVGTRQMTEYGRRCGYSLCYDMAKVGAVIVSGLARGIDGVAHRAAIDAGGITVAVLGCGVDKVYPAEHEKLQNEVMANGLLLSEYCPGSTPLGWHFPQRNRIISGLSQGVVVVEAPAKSGSIITAELALEQGRDVFALPGKVGEYNSTGTNTLIKNGARPITSSRDILEEYQALYRDKLNLERLKTRVFRPMAERRPPLAMQQIRQEPRSAWTDGAPEKKKPADESPEISEIREDRAADNRCASFSPPPESATPEEKILFSFTKNPIQSTDGIVNETGLSVGEVLAGLTMLEIAGNIMAIPGGNYQIVGD